jgi:hypothetical protein
MFTRKSTISAALIVLLASARAPLYAGDPPSADPIVAHTYQSVVPLGSDAFLLKPAKQLVYVVASAGSVALEGVQRMGRDNHALLQTSSGEPLRAYPDYIDFVVRASLVKKLFTDFPPHQVDTELEPADYLSQLRFQVRIYRGLHVTALRPAAISVESSDATSRTYRVSFAMRNVPIEDRVVLEVLDAGGRRLTKFYMGL